MSLAQPPAQERRVSPSLELGTNNPFRARLSGVPLSPGSATSDRFSFVSQNSPRERPKSRNPFLDVFDDENPFDLGPSETKPPVHRANSFDASSRPSPQLTGSAAELFENLLITDHSGNMSSPATAPPPPPNSRPRPPPPGHQKSRSGFENAPLINIEGSRPPPPPGGRRPPPGSRPRPPPNGDRSRPPPPRHRPRRNSDSSVIDAHELEAKDRRRERRIRESGKSRGENGHSKSRREPSSDRRKKNAALDVIDKLDVTGIYGSGLFHHDGPFDACNPHRNKNTRRLAPVQAFPADSANNSMTGFGPLNAKADHSHIFARDAEAFNDYTASQRPSAVRAASFDPKSAIETVHGDESLGLGTSTFLDGAPASRAAIQKTIQEVSTEERPRSSSESGGVGIQRKKSLAQKIRAIKANGPGYTADGSTRRRAPPPPGGRRSPSEGRSPTTPGEDRDGLFREYDDRDGDAEPTKTRERAPSSPKHPGVTRVGTDDGTSSGGANGLLKRVRSLSKPKRRNAE